MTETDKICQWITEQAQSNRPLVFCIEDHAGLIGVFAGCVDEGEPALGVGEDAFSAVLDAMRQSAQLALEQNGRTCPVCKCKQVMQVPNGNMIGLCGHVWQVR